MALADLDLALTLRAVFGWMLSRDQGAVLSPLSSSTTGS
jgi:hypothetical protein